MLACLVHKDNKDLSSKPTSLPPGSTGKDNRKGEEESLREEPSVAKASRPVTNGDVEYQIKRARAEGMRTYALSQQIKMMRENEDVYKTVHGVDGFNQ